MINKKTVSQCISADYCRGWNDAVDAIQGWVNQAFSKMYVDVEAARRMELHEYPKEE